jgi:TPR repeat protein
MADIVTMLAAALAVAWKAVEFLETGQSFRHQRHAAGFEKRVVKKARRVLESDGGIEGRAAARLLGDPTFAAFAVDPYDPARRQALSDRVKVDASLDGLIGPGADEEAVFAVLARAWVAATVADTKPVEALMIAKQNVTNDTLLHIINLAVDAHTKHDAASARLEEVVRRLQVDPSALLVRDPFLAQDVDLAGEFTMASDVTGDDVPAYVARDVDPRLDQLLHDADAGTIAHFVAVAGPTKSGKTRCLLEALSRTKPLHLVFTLRRTTGRDTIAALLTELTLRPPVRPWVVLVDDLYPHLADGTALAAAARKAAAIAPPGLIVATTTSATLTLTKSDRLTAGINENDIELIRDQHVELPRQATPAEQTRAQATLGYALTQAGGRASDLAHFPERLAAIPELRSRLAQARSDPEASHRWALILAAAQRALARGDRVLHTTELRVLAKCLHRQLDAHERQVGHLTDDALDEAEDWATTRVGAAYALLTPVVGTDEHLEILDDVLDQIGLQAINPRFETCTSFPDAIRLGALALVQFADEAAAIRWTQPAASAGHPYAMVNLGILLEQRRGEGDLARAEEWYRQAAEAGNIRAMVNLGTLFMDRGSEGDLARAEEWYQRAAASGEPLAMVSLGTLFMDRGSEGDLARAEEWYQRGAASGEPLAMRKLGIFLEQRGGEGDLARAEEWYRQAAEAGNIRAMVNLGGLLMERGSEGDVARAEEWYQRAADSGDALAMSSLGILFMQRGGEGDATRAEEWLHRAADAGDASAMHYLGARFQERGGEGDVTRAEEWYQRAANAGNVRAMVNLGGLLMKRGGEGDVARAEEWYRRAADSGDPRFAPYASNALARIRRDVGPQ